MGGFGQKSLTPSLPSSLFFPKLKTHLQSPPIHHPTSGLRSSSTPPPLHDTRWHCCSLHFDSSATSESDPNPSNQQVQAFKC
ncbi:hypothetical protein V6Z11_D12G028000 [Gossypium hirsutum]